MPLVLASSACSTVSQRHFSVSPRKICVRAPVTIAWNLQGEGTLESCPGAIATQEISGRGELKVTVEENTLFELWSRAEKFPYESEMVEVFYPGEELGPIGGEVVCKDGVLQAVAELDAWKWDRDIIVSRVMLRENRPQVVSHGTHSLYLKDSISTEAFRGEELVGHWAITSPLLHGEDCSDPAVPRYLAIDVTVTCRPSD